MRDSRSRVDSITSVAIVVLLSSLTWVVRVVVFNTIDSLRSRRLVVDTLLLGELLVFNQASVQAKTQPGTLVRRP